MTIILPKLNKQTMNGKWENRIIEI